MFKKVGLLTFALALGTWAAACGGDDASDPPGGGGGTGGGGSNNAEACATAADSLCEECLTRATTEFMQTITPLVTCSCQNCATQLGACFDSGNPTEDGKCRAVVECAQSTSCAGTECYCGAGVAIADCLAQGGTGLCKAQIVTAAACEGSATPQEEATCVVTARGAAGSALFRASAVGDCAVGDPLLMVAGACENL